jgi:hypothetical protein
LDTISTSTLTEPHQLRFIINQVELLASVLVTTVLMMIDGELKETQAIKLVLLQTKTSNSKILLLKISKKMLLQSNLELVQRKKKRKTMLQKVAHLLVQDHSLP